MSLGSGLPGTPSTPNPTCLDGIVHDNVTTTSQVQIDALEGCEEIDGWLEIVSFAGMDLRPLHALRVVRLNLSLGLILPGVSADSTVPIESLEGLESLERVVSLNLRNVTAPDLHSLAGLQQVSSAGSNFVGDAGIFIVDCDNLRDLSGLEGLSTWDELWLEENDNLTSLQGLVVAKQIGAVHLAHLPQLRDVSALGAVFTMEELNVTQTGLETLAGIEAIQIHRLQISGNAHLRSLDTLDRLNTVDSVLVADNPVLERMPLWAGLFGLRAIQVVGNDALQSIPSFVATATPEASVLGDRDPTALVLDKPEGVDLIEIANNRQLTSISLPTGISSSAYVGVYGNPSLTDLALGSLEGIDVLWIRNNAALRNVELYALDHVDELHVVDNPVLSMDGFAGVRSFESEVSGNASGSGP